MRKGPHRSIRCAMSNLDTKPKVPGPNETHQDHAFSNTALESPDRWNELYRSGYLSVYGDALTLTAAGRRRSNNNDNALHDPRTTRVLDPMRRGCQHERRRHGERPASATADLCVALSTGRLLDRRAVRHRGPRELPQHLPVPDAQQTNQGAPREGALEAGRSTSFGRILDLVDAPDDLTRR